MDHTFLSLPLLHAFLVPRSGYAEGLPDQVCLPNTLLLVRRVHILIPDPGSGIWGRMAKRDPEQLLTPGEASRILDLTPDTVRQLADKGHLKALRTMTGRRLFRRADVEQLTADRKARRAAKEGKGT